jgi:hypothetical protein
VSEVIECHRCAEYFTPHEAFERHRGNKRCLVPQSVGLTWAWIAGKGLVWTVPHENQEAVWTEGEARTAGRTPG